MRNEKLGVTYEEYEAERVKVYKFFEELDKKMKELIRKADVMYEKLNEKKTDKLFIDYILASQNILKLQELKVGKLERLKEMENNIVFD